MSRAGFESFADRTTLDRQLADRTANLLTKAAETRGHANLVVSGGSTPLDFFNLLSRQNVPWDKVRITLADERWVAVDHADSNERLVREKLLINKASAASFIPLKNQAGSAAEGEPECEAALAAMGRFDLLILGMGGDGHTASLFPGAANLQRGLDMHSGVSCISMQPLDAPHERMSMTLPRLLDAQQIVVHITGENKKSVLQRALVIDDHALLPVSAVLQQQQTPVTVYWAP